MTLSILIPSIPERYEMFCKLIYKLENQIGYCNDKHPSLGGVELLTDNSIKFLDGGLSIGKKREGLVNRAVGKYLCFVDDDEDVSPNYVEAILRLCQRSADVITFRNFTVLENYWMVVDMSLQFEDEQARPNEIVKRKPWHCCPVRSRFAKKYPFEDINYGEDHEWMKQVLTLCSTEAKTNEVLHCYNHGAHSEADKILKYA